MSELGQSRHFSRWPTTSGLPPEADIETAGRHVSNVPTAAIRRTPMVSGRDETISFAPRSRPETNSGYQWFPVKQGGSIMVAFILDAIYRQFLRSALPGMSKVTAR